MYLGVHSGLRGHTHFNMVQSVLSWWKYVTSPVTPWRESSDSPVCSASNIAGKIVRHSCGILYVIDMGELAVGKPTSLAVGDHAGGLLGS